MKIKTNIYSDDSPGCSHITYVTPFFFLPLNGDLFQNMHEKGYQSKSVSFFSTSVGDGYFLLHQIELHLGHCYLQEESCRTTGPRNHFRLLSH